MPRIDGLEGEKIFSAWTVLRDNPMLGKKIAVIGGGAVGLETALFLAAKGTINADTMYFLMANYAEGEERIRELMFRGSKEVTVFEMLPRVGNDIGKSTRWVIRQNLERYGVNLVTGARVVSVHGGSVVYDRDGTRAEMGFDNVVVALGSRPVKDLSEKIQGTGIPFKTVGDCVRPAKISDAVHEGFLAALEIDKIPVGA
jgi:2,4-dienoyl-CoA reductase (NADPH2)